MMSVYGNTEQESFPLVMVIGVGVNADLATNGEIGHYYLKDVPRSELRRAAYRTVAGGRAKAGDSPLSPLVHRRANGQYLPISDEGPRCFVDSRENSRYCLASNHRENRPFSHFTALVMSPSCT